MFFKVTFKYSFIVLIVSIILRVIIINQVTYDDQNIKEFEIQKESFSKNVLDWWNKGTFYLYKNNYHIFNVLSKIELDKGNLIEVKMDSRSKLPASTVVNVFLHGFPTSSFDYSKLWSQFLFSKEHLAKELANGAIFLLAFDYIGYGFSDKPFNYTYSIFDNADLVENLLLNFNILNINLIAHDMSDTVAQELLWRHNLNKLNFKINNVILTNGGIFYDSLHFVLSQKLLRIEIINRIFAKYLHNKFLFQLSFKQIFGKSYRSNPQINDDMADFFSIISYKYGNLVLPETIKYQDERQLYDKVWLNALNNTVLETMLIFGRDDTINPDELFSSNMGRFLPHVKFIKLSEEIGHYPQWEDSITVFHIMFDFLYRKLQ